MLALKIVTVRERPRFAAETSARRAAIPGIARRKTCRCVTFPWRHTDVSSVRMILIVPRLVPPKTRFASIRHVSAAAPLLTASEASRALMGNAKSRVVRPLSSATPRRSGTSAIYPWANAFSAPRPPIARTPPRLSVARKARRTTTNAWDARIMTTALAFPRVRSATPSPACAKDV